jgi:hypothetical protein
MKDPHGAGTSAGENWAVGFVQAVKKNLASAHGSAEK